MIKSSTTPRFWEAYRSLPIPIKAAAKKQYGRWLADSRHPSLHFKKVGPFWSVRITADYRALAVLQEGVYYWFWIGSHAEYVYLIEQGSF